MGRIQMRRGLRRDFDPAKLLPGEWAVTTDPGTENQIVYMCFQAGVVKRMGTYEDFRTQVSEATEDIKEEYEQTFNEIKVYMEGLKNTTEGYKNTAAQKATQASNSATQAGKSASDASKGATNAANSAEASEDHAKLSESWAKGSTGVRDGENTNNSKYYSDKSKSEADRAKNEADRASAIVGLDIDTQLSNTSPNPVQNKVITSALEGKVSEGGDISSNTVTFEQAVERAGITSDDTMSVAFGKLAKYCADLESGVLNEKVF